MSHLLRSLALLAMLSGLFATCAIATPVNLAINGFVQGRFTVPFDDNASSTFEARRGYLNFRASFDEHYSATILFSAFGPDRVLEAYAEYANAPYIGRLGLVRIPFGYEIPLSSAALIPLERSKVSMALLFPITFDRGVFGYYLPGSGFNVSLAAINGEPLGTGIDQNDNKLVTGRIGYCFPQGTNLGASFYTGDGPVPGPNFAYNTGLIENLERYGVDVQSKIGDVKLLGEYITGKNGDLDADGWYLTGAYQEAGSPWQPYLRYDAFSNEQLVELALVDYDYSRWTAGVNYYPAPRVRATLEYQNISDDANPSNDGLISTQYQVAF